MSKERKIQSDLDVDKMLDLKEDQLDSIVKECEVASERLRQEIVKNYEQAQPYLLQIRHLKLQLKKNEERMEAAKTFLAMEKNGSLLSNIDLIEMKKSNQPTVQPVNIPLQTVAIKKATTKFKSPLVANWIAKKTTRKVV